MHHAYLGLGSNLDPQKNLDDGIEALVAEFGALTLSGTYRSSAVGFSGPDFLNLVVGVSVSFDLKDFSQQLKSIEYAFGRDINATKYSSRYLDIDILTFDDCHGVHDQILLPRPEIRFNAHVLCPFAEIAPEMVLPGSNKSLLQMWREFDQGSQPLVLERGADYYAQRFTDSPSYVAR